MSQNDYDDMVAEVELVLLPAVLLDNRNAIVRATHEIGRLIGLEGVDMQRLTELRDSLGR